MYCEVAIYIKFTSDYTHNINIKEGKAFATIADCKQGIVAVRIERITP